MGRLGGGEGMGAIARVLWFKPGLQVARMMQFLLLHRINGFESSCGALGGGGWMGEGYPGFG